MKVTVKYLAQARLAAGRSSEEVEFDGPVSVHDFVVRLCRQNGSAFARMALDESGCPHPSLLVIIEDEQVRPHGHRMLRSGETVTIMTPISGG
ncbi:MAG TPA: MoaD/ThiS family protein [Planctomycetota bacterium]|nr:MoaD/ThiS family protein [Planctomycetota bacterium]